MQFLPGVLIAASLAGPSAQAPRPNKIIEANDGDVIVVRDRAAIRIVRRMEGDVRVIYNASQRWIVVLVDLTTAGKGADGRVDMTFTFNDVTGTWPLGERWEGRATVDDYSVAGELGNSGLGLSTPGGLIQILSGRRGPQGPSGAVFQDASAVASVTVMGAGRGTGGSESFDDAEQRQTAVAARNAAGLPPGPPLRSSVDLRIEGAAPVRVGGNIKTPARVEDAEPVTPDVARQANVRGVVILEIVIGPDGRVTDAKVLRSIPLLDAAALDAARKWRYEPTFLNGMAVPVIMTATVNFR